MTCDAIYEKNHKKYCIITAKVIKLMQIYTACTHINQSCTMEFQDIMMDPTIKKGDELTFVVTDITHEGLGVVRHNDYVGFVAHVLPSERVKVKIDRCKKDFFLATCVKIEERSIHRAEPFCKHFRQCGGCQLQHLSYDQHSVVKKNEWLNLYNKTLGEKCPITPQTVFETPQSYRRKARISCRWVEKKQRVCVGFREANSRYVLDGECCPLLVSKNDIFDQLSQVLTCLSIKQHVPQVEYIVDEQSTYLIFRTLSIPSQEDVQKLSVFCGQYACHGLLQINKKTQTISLQQPIDKIMQALMQQRTHSQIFMFKTLDKIIEAEQADFVQINKAMNDFVVKQAVEWAKQDQPQRILDLFCGLGNFTIPLSSHAEHTLGLEISERMVEKARSNAKTNKSSAQFEMIDLSLVNAQTWRYGSYDWVVIDPPRSGAQEIVNMISTINPQTIIYVSCKASTLMRDLMILKDYGYMVDDVVLVDMFAQTLHVESIVKISKC